MWYVGTNDAFVTIGLGKEKFQTSVKEKSEDPEWSEQCQLWVLIVNVSTHNSLSNLLISLTISLEDLWIIFFLELGTTTSLWCFWIKMHNSVGQKKIFSPKNRVSEPPPKNIYFLEKLTIFLQGSRLAQNNTFQFWISCQPNLVHICILRILH